MIPESITQAIREALNELAINDWIDELTDDLEEDITRHITPPLDALLGPSPCGRKGHFGVHWVKVEEHIELDVAENMHCTACQREDESVKAAEEAGMAEAWNRLKDYIALDPDKRPDAVKLFNARGALDRAIRDAENRLRKDVNFKMDCGHIQANQVGDNYGHSTCSVCQAICDAEATAYSDAIDLFREQYQEAMTDTEGDREAAIYCGLQAIEKRIYALKQCTLGQAGGTT